MRAVIEYPEFKQKAFKLFGEDGRQDIVSFLSENPKSGKKLEQFGGLRKLDWETLGKRGESYAIYFHPGTKNLPLAIIAIFKKHEKMILNKIIEILIHSKNIGMGRND